MVADRVCPAAIDNRPCDYNTQLRSLICDYVMQMRSHICNPIYIAGVELEEGTSYDKDARVAARLLLYILLSKAHEKRLRGEIGSSIYNYSLLTSLPFAIAMYSYEDWLSAPSRPKSNSFVRRTLQRDLEKNDSVDGHDRVMTLKNCSVVSNDSLNHKSCDSRALSSGFPTYLAVRYSSCHVIYIFT